MEFEFAPMEGITGYVYRKAHHQYFYGITEYYTPFITPNQTRKLTSREMEDVRPENNEGMEVVPQILTNKADDFLWAAEKLKQMGYERVNLNLGCPSGTVVTKYRGSGFLSRPVSLDSFFGEVSEGLEKLSMKLSVKTRIGMTDPEEFEDILSIYNKYPMEKLIIHPRLQKDYYKNKPDMETFQYAAENSIHSVCYNGDLFSKEKVEDFSQKFPQIQWVMMGRGMLTNPFLAEELTVGKEGCSHPAPPTVGSEEYRKRLLEFHRALSDGYSQVMSGDRNVLFKLKELWFYFAFLFEGEEKLLKKIKKAQKMAEFQAVAQELFVNGAMKEQPEFKGWD